MSPTCWYPYAWYLPLLTPVFLSFKCFYSLIFKEKTKWAWQCFCKSLRFLCCFEIIFSFVFSPAILIHTITHSLFMSILYVWFGHVYVTLPSSVPVTRFHISRTYLPPPPNTGPLTQQLLARARRPRRHLAPVRWSRGPGASRRSGASGGARRRSCWPARPIATTKVTVVVDCWGLG